MNDRIPPLAALRAFAAVARHGNFARAAAALHVSTSAVSHQVLGLEASLGAKLLTRARNGSGRTVVTSQGEALLAAVDAAFAQLGAACEQVRTQAARSRPVLAISANGSIASLWLAPRLAAFAAQHPSVQWQMRAIEATPDMMREGLDLAVLRARRGVVPEGDRFLFSETVFPVCSPSLGLDGDPAALLRHNLLQEEVGSSPEKEWPTWLDLLGLGRRARANVVHFDTFNAVIGAAIAGAGIALGRTPLIDLELASGRLVRPFADRALPGSWDVVLRRRPGAERDTHVGQLERFLMGETGSA
ncbi:MAG: LysR substrate-binding domain-containing protein [Acetobacteraceae bacterium]|nr:LysR substrate-binding domain-containing protein [Acetobacteraceae bacterium]